MLGQYINIDITKHILGMLQLNSEKVGITCFAMDKGERRRKSKKVLALYLVFYFGKDKIDVACAIIIFSANDW